MNKKTKFAKRHVLHNPVFCIALAGGVGLASTVALYYAGRIEAEHDLTDACIQWNKNEKARNTYMATASEFAENKKMRSAVDSIANRNNDLMDNAFDKYIAELDEKYPLGRFFNAHQIAQINKVLSSHVRKIPKDSVYKYIKSYMPMNNKTPLHVFEDIVSYLDIAPIELMPYGVEFDNGAIFRFSESRARHLFYRYLDDYAAAYNDYEKTNYDVMKYATARDEYAHNADKIRNLETQIARNDSIIHKNLAEFDATRDSLGRVITNLRKRLAK